MTKQREGLAGDSHAGPELGGQAPGPGRAPPPEQPGPATCHLPSHPSTSLDLPSFLPPFLPINHLSHLSIIYLSFIIYLST